MRPVSTRLAEWFPGVLALAIPTFFLPSLIDAFILPRAAVVVGGACLGTAIAILISGKPHLGDLKWPLVAATAAAVLAFAFSVSWPLSLAGSYTRYESLPMRLAYLGLLAVPVWLLRGERGRTAVVAGLVLGTGVASVEAVGQLIMHVPFRPDGNVGNANLLGALIAMATPLAVARFVRLDWTAPIWLVAVIVMAGGLVATTSRGGALAALAGCLALAVFAARGRVAAWLGATALVCVAGALALILFSPLRELNGDPGSARVHLYPDAVRMIAARPLTGWGEDATGLVFGRFLTGNWASGVTFDRAHAGLLDLGATQGVIGIGALGMVLVVLLGGFWRHRHALPPYPGARARRLGTIGAIGSACVAFTVWVSFNFDWAPATGAFWLLAGTGWSAVREIEGEPAPTGEARRSILHRALPAAGATLLLGLAIILAALPVLAEAWYSEGRSDLAVQADPLQAQYHRALGEALIGEGRRPEGLAELRAAGELGDSDPSLWVEIGDEELRQGHLAEARAAYRQALVIDPYWQPAIQRLAGNGGLATA